MAEEHQPEQISLVEEIESYAVSQPFVPFTIVMASGSKYPISAADFVVVGRQVTTILPEVGGPSLLRNGYVSELMIAEEDHG
jgi:hypothetical protein